MQCFRCRREFGRTELRPPAIIWRVLAFPYFFLLLIRSSHLRDEYSAIYCRACRRQISVCLFFIGFLVVLLSLVLGLQKAGLIGVQPPGR